MQRNDNNYFNFAEEKNEIEKVSERFEKLKKKAQLAYFIHFPKENA